MARVTPRGVAPGSGESVPSTVYAEESHVRISVAQIRSLF